jgi:hypothetical protein
MGAPVWQSQRILNWQRWQLINAAKRVRLLWRCHRTVPQSMPVMMTTSCRQISEESHVLKVHMVTSEPLNSLRCLRI